MFNNRYALERLGYQVETKTNPIEVLELVRSEPDRFDLVITDMAMPQVTGDKLVKDQQYQMDVLPPREGVTGLTAHHYI